MTETQFWTTEVFELLKVIIKVKENEMKEFDIN